MTQSGFLHALRWRLNLYFPPAEADSILHDYREYFEVGLLSGKSEEALCAEFGPPREIVISLTRQEKGWPVPARLLKFTASLLLLIAAVLLLRTAQNLFLYLCLSVLIPLGLVILNWERLPAAKPAGPAVRLVCLHLLQIMLLFSILALIFWINQIALTDGPGLWMAPLISFWASVTRWFSIGLWLWEICRLERAPRWALACFFLNAGICASCDCIELVLRQLDSPDRIVHAFTMSLTPFLLGLVCMAACLPVVRRFGRRG